VLTERTDVLKVRRLHVQIRVWGRFDVHDWKIVLWRDQADHAGFILASLRGLLGTVVSAARAKPPTTT
jgi:limonene-1,2-epoxide hydrolase